MRHIFLIVAVLLLTGCVSQPQGIPGAISVTPSKKRPFTPQQPRYNETGETDPYACDPEVEECVTSITVRIQ